MALLSFMGQRLVSTVPSSALCWEHSMEGYSDPSAAENNILDIINVVRVSLKH